MGELENRIKNKYLEGRAGVFKFKKDFDPNNVLISLKQITDVIDEMRKEFPKFKQFELPTIDGIEVDWKKTCRMMEQRTIEREKWFEKWLKK